MQYYDPNYKAPRRWATLAAVIYAGSLAAAFALVSFDIAPEIEKPLDEMVIDLTEITPPPPRPTPRPQPVDNGVRTPAPVERHEASGGEDKATQTPNPKALFKMSKGADEPDNAGNPHAAKGEEQAQGKGSGLDPEGLEQLDKGLRGRGLVGALPKPSYPGSSSGKVVVRVTVDSAGTVTSASFEAVGSTTHDPQLVAAAIEAARKARFAQRGDAVQSGTITYIFRME